MGTIGLPGPKGDKGEKGEPGRASVSHIRLCPSNCFENSSKLIKMRQNFIEDSHSGFIEIFYFFPDGD